MKTADYKIVNGVYRRGSRSFDLRGVLTIGDEIFEGYITQPNYYRDFQDFKSPVWGQMSMNDDDHIRRLHFQTKFPFGEHTAPLFLDAECETGMKVYGEYQGNALVVPEHLIDRFSNKKHQAYHFSRLIDHIVKKSDGMLLEFELQKL